ncbi:MAG: hypothetical protein WA938_07525 [Candidatus Dormiibacterota bacterium]
MRPSPLCFDPRLIPKWPAALSVIGVLALDLGTAAWERKYAKRTTVERGFSTLKNPDVIGMSPGLYRMRGRLKMSVLIACMWVAHNLHLRMVDEERCRKGLPRLRSTRRRRSEQLEHALAAPQASSSPTEASRAP